MQNNLLGEFECFHNAKDMWMQLKVRFRADICYKATYLVAEIDAANY